MINLQEEAKLLQEKRVLNEAMTKIEADITLSFHHWSTELNIPVEKLQRAWAKYSYEKRVGNEVS